MLTVALLIGVTGCGKKKESAVEDNQSTTTTTAPAPKTVTQPKGKPFTLTNQHGVTHTVLQQEQNLLFEDIKKPIVILHFFSTWSQPCRGEAPYLSDLQVKYNKDVAVLGILLHPDDYLQELDSFVEKNQLAYFISSGSQNDAFAKAVTKQLSLPEMLPIPLTVIYHNDRYYKHYEGVVPVEMLVHDIDTLLK